jgi:hypothetical protein
LALESGANDQLSFDEFKDKMRDQGNDDDAVRQKIWLMTRGLTFTIQLSSDELDISDPSEEHRSHSIADFSLEQAAVARQIIDAVEQNSKHLIFLQGSTGTGEIHIVRVIFSELYRRHIHCLVRATSGIAALQYAGAQTVHSLFSFGIDE